MLSKRSTSGHVAVGHAIPSIKRWVSFLQHLLISYDVLMYTSGLWNYENLGNGASGLSLALFTRALGWTPEEVEVFLVDVRKDMKNKNIHGWWPIHVVYGRKP